MSGFRTKAHNWEQILEAVNTLNRPMIQKIGESYGKAKLHQEGVAIHEVVQQIHSLAPGNHPALGPILLDLADKLKDQPGEWH
jgi:hypothetical protein